MQKRGIWGVSDASGPSPLSPGPPLSLLAGGDVNPQGSFHSSFPDRALPPVP